MLDAYKNILVAIDGSEKAEKAFTEAIAAAKRNQATLHILYVNEVTGNYFGDFGFLTPNLQEELDEVAEKQMNEHRNLAIEKGLTDIETYILYGYPKTLIANFNESKEPIDLIVMGATGLNAVERALVGSTTSYVVNHAPCNVLVIK
ncbi:universal stress protein [Enterococcus durans]|uniref:universal stress protein n=1 Tax=Enterococcus durans TaxID=53345 RepID=UPI00101E9EF1|nr:universal stress protein [Enterococcus durans]MBE8846965.1 universal stress protein [Enterococcus durans]MCA6741558.1 universal stress protein [Enterococcus durans]MCB8506422.1 universal stress protein [Enterococcus durans]MCB8516153.1 universal stress protein [Enterococcus durans]MCD5009356.1 universal stress protein [Enterococcus durans]